jgi:hypothetical protein
MDAMDIAKLTPNELEELVPEDDLYAYAFAAGTPPPTREELDALPDVAAKEKVRAVYEGMKTEVRRLIVYGIEVGAPKSPPPPAQEILDRIKFVMDGIKARGK